MSKPRVFSGLLLVLLANLGLTIHSGHHTLGTTHGSAATPSLAGHTEPDPTLHMDSLSEIRVLTCPGCLLQHQIGDGRLVDIRTLDQPVTTGPSLRTGTEHPVRTVLLTRPCRGPPSIRQI